MRNKQDIKDIKNYQMGLDEGIELGNKKALADVKKIIDECPDLWYISTNYTLNNKEDEKLERFAIKLIDKYTLLLKQEIKKLESQGTKFDSVKADNSREERETSENPHNSVRRNKTPDTNTQETDISTSGLRGESCSSTEGSNPLVSRPEVCNHESWNLGIDRLWYCDKCGKVEW